MKARMLVGMLAAVGFAVGKAPGLDVRSCHFCLLEDPSVGCISGSEKCTISSSSPCMVITIYHNIKARFNIRGCGQHNSYRCQEKRNTYVSGYWYQAQCCQYDFCNVWSTARVQSSLPASPKRTLSLNNSQVHQFYQALNLSLPLPSLEAGKEQGLGLPVPQPLDLGLSIAHLRHLYLVLNSSGLLFLPRAVP